MGLEELLREWLPAQRWFAGKDREIKEVTVLGDVELLPGDPCLRHLVVAVDYGGDVDRYQVPLGVRESLPDRLTHAAIGRIDEGRAYEGSVHESWAYDAVHDADLTCVLLENIAAGTDVGPFAFRPVPGATVETDLASLVIGAEQSNTSFVYGEEYICKLFRRLEPGPNPDLELTLALARAGSSHVAPPVGWFEAPLDGAPTTLAMLQAYLLTATDGWSLAATSVRDLFAEGDLHADEVGGDFAAESERLGTATAEIHADLARSFPTAEIGPAGRQEIAAGMRRRLDTTCSIVPRLDPYARDLRRAFLGLAETDEPVTVQRIHGDYHLGQVVRTDTGWVVLDFEGEPVKTMPERRARSTPLRDVAAMLRSFDYAARHLLETYPDGPHLDYRAREWADRNRAAFCEGYAKGGGLDPREHATLVRAFEVDKAVYEVAYEARNRPSWVDIPLAALERLAR